MYAYILSYYERFTDGYFTWKKYRIFCLTEIILTKFRIFYRRVFLELGVEEYILIFFYEFVNLDIAVKWRWHIFL